MRAVEKFDFNRGFRLSTYATMAVRRDIVRSITRAHRNRARFATGAMGMLGQQLNDERSEARTESRLSKIETGLSEMLSHLDAREQFIVKARYGFMDIGTKPTYSKLGEKLGISKERVRQLQLRAMNKLRDSISDSEMVELGRLL